ncbi:Clp protease N-terminal domain-containing protein [Kitasatospora saccharophila]|uniref:Clp protease N-terminal domain-containing protein n=1 Tax=Kitasatospora saccharophila TaxID=407973 RepID=UPI00364394DD
MPQLSDWLRLTVISRAQQEASERHHSHTDTGHLLLALLASSGSSFDSVLADQGTTAEAVRCAVEERWSAGATDGTRWWGFPVPVGELPPLSTEAGEAVRQTDRASSVQGAGFLFLLTCSPCWPTAKGWLEPYFATSVPQPWQTPPYADLQPGRASGPRVLGRTLGAAGRRHPV